MATMAAKTRVLEEVANWAEELLDQGNDPAAIPDYIAREVKTQAEVSMVLRKPASQVAY